MADKIKFRLKLSKTDAEKENHESKNDNEFSIEKTESVSTYSEHPLMESAFVEPQAIYGTATVDFLTNRIINNWLQREEGVELNLKQDPILISLIDGTPQGYVFVTYPDGNSEALKSEQRDLLKKSLTTIFSLSKS